MARVTIEDLDFAAEWLGTYDPAPGEAENGERAARVVEWLRAEISRREAEMLIRRGAKELGVSASQVRESLARRRAAE